MRIAITSLSLLALLPVLATAADEKPYRTAAVERGDLVATVRATGTLEPEQLVDVSAQVSGVIAKLGADAAGKQVDYNSLVEEGAVLAEIDNAIYAADVQQQQAQCDLAQAALAKARAELQSSRTDLRRMTELAKQKLVANEEMEAAKARCDRAEAEVAGTEAALAAANAGLKKAQLTLSYTVIKSPIKGVIIDRRVNVGEKVVAALNSPSLFLVAKDLRKMQVWVAVNEADIGKIHAGQPVTFTTDTIPGRTFKGEVGKVRLNANRAQNVVTYTVEVPTDNADMKLLPYCTASVLFETDTRKNVLLVPNAALRWRPKEAAGIDFSGPAKHSVWVPQPDGSVIAVAARVGGTDGAKTEVSGDGLREGMQVIVGQNP